MSRISKLIITMWSILLLWILLEIYIYGEAQPRIVDTIMWLIWGASLVMAYKEGEGKHGN